ncbi:MAG: choice-of-anchor L domain-containing protein [Flavobacteriales bacterium]
MNKLYALGIICLTMFQFRLQSQSIQIDTAANWQQFIPTILGGSCLEISNVSYNAGQYTAARFTNGQVIGINEGIVITTGRVMGINNTPDHFLNMVNNMPGDPMLTQIAGWPTYDATSLEFDFTSPVSGQVSVRYVFASEEYPEFVGTSFNDIFGFFVSDADGNTQNIAVINGNIPVTINSINHIDNSNFYIETAEIDSFAYDGRTVVLTSVFSAEANQTYHLKISISDAGDPNFDSAIFLESITMNPQAISGTASLAGDLIQSGVVEMFGFNTDSTMANLIDSYTITSDGAYFFNDVEAGAYLLKVSPDASLYPNALPKYYNNAYLWQYATIISFPCQNYSVGLSLAPIFTGSSSVSGSVFFTNSVMRSASATEGEAMSNVSVWLYSVSLNEFARHTLTNEDGFYQFSGLDAGTYRIYVDIPGLPQEDYHEFELLEAQAQGSKIYLVGLNKIIIAESTLSTTSLTASDWMVYPNPYQNELHIKGGQSGKVHITLFDMQGRRVFNHDHNNLIKDETIKLFLPGLENGVYMLQLQHDTHTFVKRIIKN